MTRKILKPILTAVLALTAQACGIAMGEDDPNNPALSNEAPRLPDPGTLSLEFDDFSTAEMASSPASSENSFTLNGINFSTAATIVRAATAAVTAQLLTPAAALKSVQDVTPIKTSDKTWKWAGSFSLDSVDWTTELTGERTGTNSTTWNFKMTRSPVDQRGCCTNFTWLSGATDAATSGTWVVNDPDRSDELTPQRVIDWTYASPEEKSITVTVKKPLEGSEWEPEGWLQFTVDSDTQQLTIDKDPASQEKTVINWSKSTKAGRHNKENGTTVCWNENRENIPCS